MNRTALPQWTSDEIFCSFVLTLFIFKAPIRSFVLTLFIFKAPNYDCLFFLFSNRRPKVIEKNRHGPYTAAKSEIAVIYYLTLIQTNVSLLASTTRGSTQVFAGKREREV